MERAAVAPGGFLNKCWRDAEERLVREHVVGTASIDCVDDAVFLYLGWPLGTPFDKVDAAHVYVRDHAIRMES